MGDKGALLQLFTDHVRLVFTLQLQNFTVVGETVEGHLFQGPDVLGQIGGKAVGKGNRLYMERAIVFIWRIVPSVPSTTRMFII